MYVGGDDYDEKNYYSVTEKQKFNTILLLNNLLVMRKDGFHVDNLF